MPISPGKLRACGLIVAAVAMTLTGGCKPMTFWRRSPATPETPPAPAAPEALPQQAPLTLDPQALTAAPQADPADGGAIMAYVNTRPLYMSELHRLLVDAYGLKFAQQLIINEIVRQEALAKGITVSDQDVRDEHERTLRETFASITDQQQRQRLFEDLLAQRNLTRHQWDMGMRRNALIRQMIPANIEVTDEELHRAFGNVYGRQVVVRHLQTTSLAKAQKLLSELTAGADFAELAEKESTHESAANGGLLPAFGKDTQTVWPAFREAALSLRTVGELSNPVQTGTVFHIIRLEKIIEPAKVRFEDVKDTLAENIRLLKTRALQQQILKDLIRRAQTENRITYIDPSLKAQAEKEQTP